MAEEPWRRVNVTIRRVAMSGRLPRLRPWTWSVLLLLGWFVVPGWLQRGLVGEVAPRFDTTDLSGRAFDVGQSGGRPTLLYFWGAWCPICAAMQPSINAVAGDHPVVTIALRSGTRSELVAQVRKEGFAARVIPDEDGAIADSFGVRGVPALYVVDRDGRVQFSTTGYTTELGIRARLWLAATLD
jgi:thiol-disulfide isomerase/thioredoxin